METPLRLLLVEDSREEARRVTRRLRRAGYRVECRRVETEAELRVALAAPGWDLVIAKDPLPKFSAPAALAALREQGLDLPFLVIAETCSEGRMVAALKGG